MSRKPIIERTPIRFTGRDGGEIDRERVRVTWPDGRTARLESSPGVDDEALILSAEALLASSSVDDAVLDAAPDDGVMDAEASALAHELEGLVDV